jgi:hypothetical protein
MNKVELRKAISSRFTVEEIQDICFELGIEYQNMSSRLNTLARELVEHCERTNRLPELLNACRRARPQFDDWKYTPTQERLIKSIEPTNKEDSIFKKLPKKLDWNTRNLTRVAIFLLVGILITAFLFSNSNPLRTIVSSLEPTPTSTNTPTPTPTIPPTPSPTATPEPDFSETLEFDKVFWSTSGNSTLEMLDALQGSNFTSANFHESFEITGVSYGVISDTQQRALNVELLIRNVTSETVHLNLSSATFDLIYPEFDSPTLLCCIGMDEFLEPNETITLMLFFGDESFGGESFDNNNIVLILPCSPKATLIMYGQTSVRRAEWELNVPDCFINP